MRGAVVSCRSVKRVIRLTLTALMAPIALIAAAVIWVIIQLASDECWSKEANSEAAGLFRFYTAPWWSK